MSRGGGLEVMWRGEDENIFFLEGCDNSSVELLSTDGWRTLRAFEGSVCSTWVGLGEKELFWEEKWFGGEGALGGEGVLEEKEFWGGEGVGRRSGLGGDGVYTA
jgi:hypothetical protein